MNSSVNRNPLELVDRYLQAVRFWLPKAQQEDIVAELSEDLHSQIEEKESALGRPLNEDELEEFLRRCGSPIVVASRYQPPTQLIGPVLFPIYKFVLKLVLLWVLLPIFILIVAPAMIVPAPHRWEALMQTISTLWTVLFANAAIITLVFAVLERTQAKLHLFDKWNPRSLPPAAKRDKTSSRTQTVFELIFGIIGLLWLLAVPFSPVLVLGPFVTFLKPAPLWSTFYIPLILLALAGIAHQLLSLARPQWTWLPPAARLLTSVLTLLLLHFILNAATQTPGGQWHPYVVLADSAQGSAQQTNMAAIVNLSVLLSLVIAYLGLGIAAIVQTWQLLRYFRKSAFRKKEAASQAT